MEFPQATQFLSALGELVQADAATMDALAAVPGRLYVMVIVGEGRAGKSTILNAIIARLAQRGLLADVRAAACGGVCQTFVTGPDVDPVTHGSRVCILRLRAGGAVVLIDSEGLLNRDRPFLNLQLGLLSQCTSRLVFVANNFNDVLRDSIARLVGARLVEGAAPVMPYLHILLNPQVRPLELFAAAMDRWFDQGGDAAALNAAFPRERRSIGRLCAAREVLDGQTANAVLASYFGLDLIAWLNGFVDEWLAQPFTVNGVALTGAAFAMFVRESVSNTNAHVAAGRVIVQPAANLGALVAARCRCAVDHAIAVYDNDGSRPRRDAITGRETSSAVTAAHGAAAAAATAALIADASMFDTWSCYRSEQRRLEHTLATRLSDVLEVHRTQAALREAEDEQQRVAEELARAQAKLLVFMLVAIRFVFHTTDQELDHDSVVDVYVRLNDNTTLVGSAGKHHDSGKQWGDHTTNTLNLALVNDVASKCTTMTGLRGRVDMRAKGSNRWHFNLDVYFAFQNGHGERKEEHFCNHGYVLNSTGSRCVGDDINF